MVEVEVEEIFERLQQRSDEQQAADEELQPRARYNALR